MLLEQHIPLPISDSDAGWVIFALVQLFQRQNLFSFRFLAYAAHITNLNDEIHGVLFFFFFFFFFFFCCFVFDFPSFASRGVCLVCPFVQG